MADSPASESPRRPPPVALTVAGSDSGGGAGIQADLKTFHSFRVFGTSVVTAITAQNTVGVRAIHPVPAAEVRAQLDAVMEDLAPAAMKSGMLGGPDVIEAVADGLAAHAALPWVLDPVMVATSGDRLLPEASERLIVDRLLPMATVVTPNLAEAEVLLGEPVIDLADMARAAKSLVDAGAAAALVKGGHLPGGRAADLLFDGERETIWDRTRIDSGDTHGTGCTLSAAIAAGLAHGLPLVEAVDQAIAYVVAAIRSAPGLGHGHGPLDHWARPGRSTA